VVGRIAHVAAMGFSSGSWSGCGGEGRGEPGSVEDDEVGPSDGRYRVLRKEWAAGGEAGGGAFLVAGLKHGAAMLAVTAAAGREACVGVLSEGEHRRDDRKAESGEQDEAEEAAHGR